MLLSQHNVQLHSQHLPSHLQVGVALTAHQRSFFLQSAEITIEICDWSMTQRTTDHGCLAVIDTATISAPHLRLGEHGGMGEEGIEKPGDKCISRQRLLYMTSEIQQFSGLTRPEQWQHQLTCQCEWWESHKTYPWMKSYTHLIAAKKNGESIFSRDESSGKVMQS